MRNHPDTIESLNVLIQDLLVTSPDNERPGWTTEQFQQALVKLDVPMSDQDSQDIYQYIDQKGDGDGILQHSDLSAVIEELRRDNGADKALHREVLSSIKVAVSAFSKSGGLQPASPGTIHQLTGSTDSSHVVYISPEGAPLVYSLISFGMVGDLLLLAVQDPANATANLDCVMSENVQLDNGKLITWAEVALNGRGSEGETVLHLCTLLGTDAHANVVRYLLTRFGGETAMEEGQQVQFCNAAYTGSLYRGEVALHIAAVSNDHRITKMLIQSGARLNRPFASGTFFTSTAIGYGGTVLGFACVNSDFVLFEMLVNAGAIIDVVDQFGNSLLHLCIRVKRVQQFKYLTTTHGDKMKKFLHAPNADGLTPLLLAVETRDYEMFETVEKACRETIWEFGNVVAYKMSLDYIDPLIAHEFGYKSLLDLIVEQNIWECTTPLVAMLIDDKWHTYAKYCYYLKLTFFFADLMLLALALHGVINMFWSFLSVLIIHAGETTATLGVLLYNSRRRPWRDIFSEIQSQLREEVLPFTYAGLVVVAFIINEANQDIQDTCPDFQKAADGANISFIGNDEYNHCFCKEASILLGCASAVGWWHFLNHLKGSKLVGVPVLMFQEMIRSDSLKWSILYLCVLIGFTEAIWAVTPRTGHSDYSVALIEMFQTTLSDPFMYGELKVHGLEEWAGVMFWLIFTFLSAIVLMNQLIAMMGETYSRQRAQAHVTWKILRAGIILESERSIMGRLVELWHRKKLRDIRPNHHLKGVDKLGLKGKLVHTWHIVVEERMDQACAIQETWAPRNTDVTTSVAGVGKLNLEPQQVLSDSPEITLLEVAKAMLEKKKSAASALGDNDKVTQLDKQINALNGVISTSTQDGETTFFPLQSASETSTQGLNTIFGK